MHEIEATPEERGERLDVVLARRLPHLTRSRIQQLIRAAAVRCNGAPPKAGYPVRPGDRIELEEVPREVERPPTAEAIPLRVLHEDADLLVLDKAPGLVVHPAAGNWSGTLVNALLHHSASLSSGTAQVRPGIVHRLDKDTSGCMVVAKNDTAHLRLSKQFAAREVLKIYLATVRGVPRPTEGTIDEPIGRHPRHRKRMAVVRSASGRNARTDYRVLRNFGTHSLVECRLHTGRTHQIRVHMDHVGHPLCGDPIYGKEADWPRLMLHAWKLGFHHPATEKWMVFEAPIPEDFRRAGIEPLP
jgi:23S rRNA pseudouridine1911/1915/1917 synthase